MKSLQGRLLLASTDLVDPNFLRTAVLMIQHGPEGALGLILNRPTTTTVRDAVKHVSELNEVRQDALLRLGGPCQGSLMAIHCQPLLKEVEVLPNVYFSAGADNLEKLLAMETSDPMLFFVGFSGWAQGQLESELESGSWRVAEATGDDVFYHGKDLWEKMTRTLVSNEMLSALKIKHVPNDPSMN